MNKILKIASHIISMLCLTVLLVALVTTNKVSAAQDLHVFFEIQGEPKDHFDERGKLYDVLWGYKDAKGNVIIEPKYAAAGHFFSERAFVRNVGENDYVLIDTDGNELSSERYSSFYTNMVNDRAIVSILSDENKLIYALIDKNGKHLIESSFMINGSGDYFYTIDSSNKTGNIYNANGKVLLKNVEDLSKFSVTPYNDGFILYIQHFNPSKFMYGFYNKNGKEIIPLAEGSLTYYENCIVRDDSSTNKITLYNHKGKKIKTLSGGSYNDNGPRDGLIMASKFNLGILEDYYITQKGKVVKTANILSGQSIFSYVGAGMFKDNGKYTLLDKNGKVIKTFTDAVWPYENGLFQVTDKKGKIHVVNAKGKTVIKSGKYDTISKYSVYDVTSDGTKVERKLLKVTKGNKQGLIDENGKVIIPAKYDSVSGTNGGFLIVKQNDKYGLYNLSGKEVLPIKYERVVVWGDISGMNTFAGNNIVASMSDGKTAFYDLSGKLMGIKDNYGLNSEIF